MFKRPLHPQRAPAYTRTHEVHATRRRTTRINSLPNEILLYVLSLVPGKWLLPNCALVCRTWRELISSRTFWRNKCLNVRKIRRFIEMYMSPCLPEDWKRFYFSFPSTKNLIKNPSGREGLSFGWVHTNGENPWSVEMEDGNTGRKPARLLAISDGSPHHFAAPSGWSERYQVIDLLAEGFSARVLDEEQPDVVVSQWYATCSDCTTTFEFTAELLRKESGENSDVISCFGYGPIYNQKGTSNSWKDIMFRFYKYGRGLRFIRFTEQSRNTDKDRCPGHCGPKTAGCVVRLEFHNRVYEWDESGTSRGQRNQREVATQSDQ